MKATQINGAANIAWNAAYEVHVLRNVLKNYRADCCEEHEAERDVLNNIVDEKLEAVLNASAFIIAESEPKQTKKQQKQLPAAA